MANARSRQSCGAVTSHRGVRARLPGSAGLVTAIGGTPKVVKVPCLPPPGRAGVGVKLLDKLQFDVVIVDEAAQVRAC